MSDHSVFRCASCGRINRLPTARLSEGPRCGGCHQPLDVGGHPQPVDDAQLERLVSSSPVPVLVDFYADWCGPCRHLAPTLGRLAGQHAGELIVVKVDTDRHSRTASRLGVRGIPAVYLYKGGEVVAEASGAHPLPHWQQLVAPHL